MNNMLLIRNLGEQHEINGYTVVLNKCGFDVYFNKECLDGKIAKYIDKYIIIETEEENRLFSEFFTKLGFKWSDGRSFLDKSNFRSTAYSISPKKGYWDSSSKDNIYLKDFIVKEQLYFKYSEKYHGTEIYDMYDNIVFENDKYTFKSNPFLEEMKKNCDLIIKELKRMEKVLIDEINSGERYKDFFEKINKPLEVNNF